MAACTWYGPGRPRRSARLEQASALVDLGPVPAGAVLVLQRDQVARGVEPGRAPGVLQQHQRQQPAASGSSGISAASTRASRMASAHRPCRIRSAPAVAE